MHRLFTLKATDSVYHAFTIGIYGCMVLTVIHAAMVVAWLVDMTLECSST